MTSSTGRSLLPSLGDFVFLFIFLFPLMLLPTIIFSDGGSGWHLATGEYICQHGQIPRTDFMSYTFANKPWIALYWLSDLLMYLAFKIGGLNAVAVLSSAVLSTVYLLIYKRSRDAGCNFMLVTFMIFTAAIASSFHFMARPHIFTYLGFFISAFALDDFYRDKISLKKFLITLAIVMLLWVNLHPGFIYIYGLVGVYLACAVAGAILNSDAKERSAFGKKSLGFIYAMLTCIVLAFASPDGVNMVVNLLQTTFTSSVLMDNVDEFMSPNFHGGIQIKAFELMLGLTMGALAIGARRPSLPLLLCVIAFTHLALYSVRHIPVFLMLAVPLAAESLAQTRLSEYYGANGNRLKIVDKIISQLQNFSASIDETERKCTYHILPVVAVVAMFVVACCNGKFFSEQVLDCKFSADTFPTTTLAKIAELKLKPEEGFNQVNWGGYIFFTTHMPIYIDDRASFFGEPFYVQYGRIISLFPDWKQLLEKEHIRWVVFPKRQNFARALSTDPEWKIEAEDPAAYLLVKKTPSKS